MPARATLSTDNSFGESLVRHSQVSRGSLGESLIEDAAAATVVPPRCEPPDMWAWSHAALYAHYACIGVVNGLLTQALLPYCLYVAHGEPNTCATLSTFVNLPWGFKLLYGALSDCVPICGRHRKPYLVLGWLLTLVISLALALLPRLDLQLASSLFLAMTVAYLLADCAADAALVGISTREPAESRGSILSTAYFIRFTANILSAAVVAFLYNGPPTCGSFPFGLSTQQLMWIVVVCVAVFMGLTLPFYDEPRAAAPPPSLRSRATQLHALLQQPAVWRLILALTTTTALSLVTNQAQTNANKEWFHIEPLQLGLSTCFQNIMLAVGTYAYKRYLLNASWRRTYAVGILGQQVFNLLYLLTVYTTLFKNGWWYVFTQVDMEFAYAFTFVIGVIMVPEITLPGYEGIIYGAITTYINQAQNITNALNNLLLALWPSNANNADLRLCAVADAAHNGTAFAASPSPQCDAAASPPPSPSASSHLSCAAVQAHMAWLTLMCVGIACTSLVFIRLMPSQKRHVAELAALPPSRRAGVCMELLLLLLIIVGPAFAILPVFPQMACLRIAGGSGCGG